MSFIYKHLALLLALSICALLPAQTDCTSCMSVHTGTFYEISMPEVTIERDSLHQLETDSRSGTKSYYSVRWVNECVYELTFIKSPHPEMRKSAEVMGVLHVMITEVLEDVIHLRLPLRG